MHIHSSTLTVVVASFFSLSHLALLFSRNMIFSLLTLTLRSNRFFSLHTKKNINFFGCANSIKLSADYCDTLKEKEKREFPRLKRIESESESSFRSSWMAGKSRIRGAIDPLVISKLILVSIYNAPQPNPIRYH